MSVADNLVLNTPRRAPFARHGTRNLAAVNAQRQDSSSSDFDIRTTSIQAPAGSLSGVTSKK